MDEQLSRELIETLKSINENLNYLQKIDFNLNQFVETCTEAKKILDSWADTPK
ncbi:MAG: hypothetical protein JXB49_32105 [Bacteroidales bacterium]|nr:hypothetical protein [Bacteroidales bacterium]